MNYNKSGYSVARRILANCDKCSFNGQSNVVRSPWGVIRMYNSSLRRGRFYSVSGSTNKKLPNGGSYRMSTLRRILPTL